MAEVKNNSAEPQHRTRLLEVSWQDIPGPGAYVELGSGDLYRVPKEALLQGSSPLIRKESAGASSLMQVSNNPYITTFEARMICCEHNIVPNF
ncbi:hypothetical protein NVV94_10615 [Pseudomonas sp. LS1212]|uniref:hypothetical protein n=1 Tax=Pseudomonas sp. LS1212 TaxID=2972478 RepID=UPI00215C489F|nr:hypothetical protein [Pseudomonas sp. LS1212]UVJ45948.1 hypothetical protein NVV94_10615 [Pseudomonas sp. LS1212]